MASAAKVKPVFASGDRVAWSHSEATKHAPGSIVYASAIQGLPPEHPLHGDPGTGQLGTVQGPGNDVGTYWSVLLDGDKEPRVLTSDELVRVVEPEEVPA